MKKRLLSVVLFAVAIVNAQQKQDSIKTEKLDEVVVSDSRFKLKKANSGKTVIKILEKELAQNQGKTLSEIINTKSGIEINGSRSNAGKNLSYFVRGGNNRQVLVLVDGVQMSDPSQIANDYNLNLIPVNQIETIEIIKGASSTLYGNGAATAVINITTKKANKKSITAQFSSSIGSNQTQDDKNYNIADFINLISVNGTVNKLSYLTSFSHQYADGMSAIKNGTERDAYNNIGVNANLAYSFSDKFSAKIMTNHTKIKADFDDAFLGLDANNISKSEQNKIGTSLFYKYNTKGDFTINATYNTIFRTIESTYPNTFIGKSTIIDAFNKYTFNDNIHTIIGVNFKEDKADFSTLQKNSNLDSYFNTVFVSDFGLNINAGLRLNNHSEYGTHLIYNLNPSFRYNFERNYLKVLGSFATSYIAPSLYQQFGDGGFVLENLDLKPEENTTIEAGFEINLNKKTTFSALAFKREEDNVKAYETVDFVTFQGQYKNTNKTNKVAGFEIEFNTSLIKNLAVNANYTFTERKEDIAYKIPKHKANVNLSYHLNKQDFSLNYQYVDDRFVKDFSTFPASNLSLKSFSLVDLHYQRTIIKNRLNINALISNIFNTDYTEVLGFSTKGRNVKLGFNLMF